jgi:hypothetical protein
MFVVKKKIQVTRRQFYQPRQAVIRAGKKTQLHAYPAYYVRTLKKKQTPRSHLHGETGQAERGNKNCTSLE